MPITIRRLLLAGFALVSSAVPVLAQQVTGPGADIRASRTPQPPVIDGRLNDEVWGTVEAASQFTQRDPDEGKPATERTEVRFLYDNDALYIAARLHDSQPEQI